MLQRERVGNQRHRWVRVLERQNQVQEERRWWKEWVLQMGKKLVLVLEGRKLLERKQVQEWLQVVVLL
jgi:peptidyl-tRNA hydrolase